MEYGFPLRYFYRDSQEMMQPKKIPAERRIYRAIDWRFGGLNGNLAYSKYNRIFARFLTITVILVVFKSFLWHDIGTSQPVDMSQLSALIPSSAADYRAGEKE